MCWPTIVTAASGYLTVDGKDRLSNVPHPPEARSFEGTVSAQRNLCDAAGISFLDQPSRCDSTAQEGIKNSIRLERPWLPTITARPTINSCAAPNSGTAKISTALLAPLE